MDEQQAVGPDAVDVTAAEDARPARVVEEQRRHRQRKRDPVAREHEATLEAADQPPPRKAEHGVREGRHEELPSREAEGEHGRVAAVTQLADEQRERDDEHQPPEPVLRSADQPDDPGRQERPGDGDARDGLPPRRAQVVGEEVVAEDAEADPGDGDRGEEAVTFQHSSSSSRASVRPESLSLGMKPRAPLSSACAP